MIPAVYLVGYSNSGKTTVLKSIIKIMKEKGFRVATIKHAPHGYDVDMPGKDSYHFFQAGADKVVVVGPASITVHEQSLLPPTLSDALRKINDHDADILFIEGFKNEPGPKIEVLKDGNCATRVPDIKDLLAVVSDTPVPEDVPRFSFQEMEKLVDFIIKAFALKAG